MCVLGFFLNIFFVLLLLFFYASKRVDNSFFRYYIKVFKFRIYKGSAEVRVSVVTHFVRLPASQGSQKCPFKLGTLFLHPQQVVIKTSGITGLSLPADNGLITAVLGQPLGTLSLSALMMNDIQHTALLTIRLDKRDLRRLKRREITATCQDLFN